MRHCQRRRNHTPADGRDPERRRDVRGGLRQRDDGVGVDPEWRRRLRDRCHHRRRVPLVGTIGDPANLRGLVLVGLDVGATRATAVAIDETGAVQASASAEYPADGKASGGLEQDPSEWWRASQRALAEVAGTAGGEVAGIGLTGQTAGAVFMDARGIVVRPAIVGGDRRALPQSVAITERVGRDRLLEITGNAVASDGLASTLLWVRDVEPVQFRHTRRVLAPKDYVRLMLTGEAVTDVTDASGTTLHALPQAYRLRARAAAAGAALHWWGGILGGHFTRDDLYQLAASAPMGSNGLFFLPHCESASTTPDGAGGRGAFAGLRAHHTRADLTRAVMEGVIFSLRDGLDRLRELGIEVRQVRTPRRSGGAWLWGQLQAGILVVPVESMAATATPAMGAALLAGVAFGRYASVADAAPHTIQT